MAGGAQCRLSGRLCARAKSGECRAGGCAADRRCAMSSQRATLPARDFRSLASCQAAEDVSWTGGAQCHLSGRLCLHGISEDVSGALPGCRRSLASAAGPAVRNVISAGDSACTGFPKSGELPGCRRMCRGPACAQCHLSGRLCLHGIFEVWRAARPPRTCHGPAVRNVVSVSGSACTGFPKSGELPGCRRMCRGPAVRNVVSAGDSACTGFPKSGELRLPEVCRGPAVRNVICGRLCLHGISDVGGAQCRLSHLSGRLHLQRDFRSLASCQAAEDVSWAGGAQCRLSGRLCLHGISEVWRAARPPVPRAGGAQCHLSGRLCLHGIFEVWRAARPPRTCRGAAVRNVISAGDSASCRRMCRGPVVRNVISAGGSTCNGISEVWRAARLPEDVPRAGGAQCHLSERLCLHGISEVWRAARLPEDVPRTDGAQCHLSGGSACTGFPKSGELPGCRRMCRGPAVRNVISAGGSTCNGISEVWRAARLPEDVPRAGGAQCRLSERLCLHGISEVWRAARPPRTCRGPTVRNVVSASGSACTGFPKSGELPGCRRMCRGPAVRNVVSAGGSACTGFPRSGELPGCRRTCRGPAVRNVISAGDSTCTGFPKSGDTRAIQTWKQWSRKTRQAAAGEAVQAMFCDLGIGI